MVKATINWSAKKIAQNSQEGSLTFENIIQRGNVWDKKRQSLFIDSLIRDYPVPPIFTIKTNGSVHGNTYDCIDGKQRCKAIQDFYEGKLVLEGLEPLEYNGKTYEINGETYETLPEKLRDAFDGYTLNVYYFSEVTDDEISDMMSRLNNGKPLTCVELSRIKAKDKEKIINLGKHRLFWVNLSEKKLAAYHNEDIVIKTALQIFDNQFEFSSKNVRMSYETFDFTNERCEQLERIFNKADNIIEIIKENYKKNIVNRIIKKTNFVGSVYFVYNHLNTDEKELAEFLALFFGDKGSLRSYVDDYDEASTNGTNHSCNVIQRNSAMERGFEYFDKNIWNK